MQKPKINSAVLVSGADYFQVEELNPYSHKESQPNVQEAIKEHRSIISDFKTAGITVTEVNPPPGCYDGVYAANWALCWQGKAVMANLPNERQPEEPYALKEVSSFGLEIIRPEHRFSGQGDALPCGEYLFVGSNYRTDTEMHSFLQANFNCKVIGLQTIPLLDSSGLPIINKITGWPDSYFYDIDLALAILTPELIAWCPEAFVPESAAKIEALPLDKITVSLAEAKEGFACNLVSTGECVIMSQKAPQLKAAIEKRGLQVLTPSANELAKGGGYIRCISLTLD